MIHAEREDRQRLNGYDSLKLLRETLPSRTLLQLRNKRGVARRPRALLNSSPGSSLISMSLSGKSVDFTKVFAMPEEMDFPTPKILVRSNSE